MRAANNKKIPLEEQAQGVYELCVCTATWGGGHQNIKRVQKGAANIKKIPNYSFINVDRTHFVLLVQLKAASNCQRSFLDRQQPF